MERIDTEEYIRQECQMPHKEVKLDLCVIGRPHRIGLPEVLGSRRSSSRDRVLALVVQRVLKPASKLATAEWLGTSFQASGLYRFGFKPGSWELVWMLWTIDGFTTILCVYSEERFLIKAILLVGEYCCRTPIL